MNSATKLLKLPVVSGKATSDELLPLVYDELRKLAAAKLRKEMPGQTLQATALVHEAWMRLASVRQEALWDSKGHFFAAASEAMRRILIDRARSKKAEKRGGGIRSVDLSEIDLPAHAGDDLLLWINELLQKLADEAPESAEIVKLRFFTGATVEEAAEMLEVSDRTARRYWRFARAWLRDRLGTDRQLTALMD